MQHTAHEFSQDVDSAITSVKTRMEQKEEENKQ